MIVDLEYNLISRVAVGDFLRRSARRFPDKEALVEYRGGKRLAFTYEELNRLTNRFARACRRWGLRPGERVAAIGGNSWEYLVAAYGLAKAGLVWVPINARMAVNDILYVLQHSEARTVILDDLAAGYAEVMRRQLGLEHLLFLPVTGAPLPEGETSFPEFLEGASDEEVEDVLINDRDVVQIMYTSGTTSRPKGALITHLQVVFAALFNIGTLLFSPDERLLCMMPLFHCAQHTLVNSAFTAGATVILLRAFDPALVLRVVETERLTWLFALPVMYRALVDHPDIDRYDLSSVTRCLYALAPMDRNTLARARRKFSRAEFLLGTGQTECYPATNVFFAAWAEGEANYWGRSLLGVETAIMDEEGNLLPPGRIGEIVWRAPTVMAGYFKDPEATAQARRHGWHHSGDLGYFNEDGLLVFVDRKKDMIKTGGENVPSIKVEEVLLSHPEVAAAAVIGLPHPRWGEAVTAFVVPKEKGRLTSEEVISYCKQHLSGFEVPKAVVFLEELPTTATGKVRKYVLRQQYRDYYLHA